MYDLLAAPVNYETSQEAANRSTVPVFKNSVEKIVPHFTSKQHLHRKFVYDRGRS